MTQKLLIGEGILQSNLKKIFGSRVQIQNRVALTGGARKKVVRLQLSDGVPDLVLLFWQNEHDYFEERDNPDSDRSDRAAPLLYQANTKLLHIAGVHVPKIYGFDASYQQVPYAYALVEYVEAVPFNEWKTRPAQMSVQELFSRISACLNRMHCLSRDRYGNLLDSSLSSIPCHQLAFQEACRGLEGLVEWVESVQKGELIVRQKLEELYHAVQPRQHYCFIHDELGPDEHLLIDRNNQIVLIDVDGCHYFDLEREHAYLKLRFGEDYRYLHRDDLDEERMRFYTYCIHISAAYGHYLLYQKGYPEPEMLRGIYEHNIQKFLSLSLE
jgi:hypothetical protein